jgi:hypothetical protein
MLPFTCPNCGKTGRIPEQFRGRTVKCPACEQVVKVPETVSQSVQAKPSPAAWDDGMREVVAALAQLPEEKPTGTNWGTILFAAFCIFGGAALVIGVAAVLFSRPNGEMWGTLWMYGVFWLFALVLAWLTGEKRTIGGPVAVLCVLLLSWLGFLIVVLFPYKRAPEGPTRTCPYCAEKIRAAARVCRFCNREVMPLPARPI